MAALMLAQLVAPFFPFSLASAEVELWPWRFNGRPRSPKLPSVKPSLPRGNGPRKIVSFCKSPHSNKMPTFPQMLLVAAYPVS
jgi:hypothetical protein